jgi:hypothetical protein
MTSRRLLATIVEKKLERPRLTLSYPYVTGLPNPEAAVKINAVIQDLVFRLLRDEGYARDRTKEFWGSYKIRVNQNGVLSLSVELNYYEQGAAHGMTVVKSLTFDLHSGHAYRFPELFRKGSNCKEIINYIVKHQMEEREVPLIAEFDGIRDDPDYYLTDQALVVYFQLYEYTPYAYGFPEFSIPYRYLLPVADPAGPIPRLIRS